MRKIATFLLLVGVTSSLAGCSKGCSKTSPGAELADAAGPGAEGSSDASTKATTAVYTGPLEPHVAARSLSYATKLVELANGKILLDAGIYVYELTPDGLVRLLGEPASYVAHLPDGDDQLGGYGTSELVTSDRTLHGLPSGDVVLAIPPLAWTWTGKGWTKRADISLVGEVAGDRRDPYDVRDVPDMMRSQWNRSRELADMLVDMPPGIDGGDLRRAVDGTGVVIGVEPGSNGSSPISVVVPPRSRKGALVPIDAFDRSEHVHCTHVPSWSRPYLRCAGPKMGVVLYRLEGQRWERAPVDVPEGAIVAVGHAGAVWLGLPEGGKVQRILAPGRVDDLGLPAGEFKTTPSYYVATEYVQTKTGGADDDTPSARRWDHVSIMMQAPAAVRSVTQIVPRADGEAWVLATDKDNARLLVHLARPAIAPVPEPVLIGSEVDQRNEVRSARGTRSWAAHCPLLFVTLAKQRADGSFSSEGVWGREKELGALLKKTAVSKHRVDRPSASLVEGRLAGRRVAGVLVWRGDFATGEDMLENAAHALIDDGARNGPPPDVTCSAPVLERASEL